MKNHILFLLLAGTLFIFCSTKKENRMVHNTQDLPTEDSLIVADVALGSELNADSQLEAGIIRSAEDAGYPLISLNIEFPARNWEEAFNLNVEKIKGLKHEQVLNGIGKSVGISFKKEMTAALMDLQTDGTSIFSISTTAPSKKLKKITGILSGAENSTAGDLPDTLTITSSEKEKVSFQYFITPEIVKYNGKKLTAIYADRINNKVLNFKML